MSKTEFYLIRYRELVKAQTEISKEGRSCYTIQNEFNAVVTELNKIGADLPLKPETASDGQTSLFSEAERPAVKPYLES